LLHVLLGAATLAFDNPWSDVINTLASGISVVLDFINAHITHNYGWSMLALALAATTAMLPLYLQMFRSVKEMQAIQPYIKRLQDRYKDDRQKLAEEQMKLFREHNINPFGGCLPTLIQLPIFFAIYQAIRSHTTQFAHAGWLWIGSAFAAHGPALPAWLPWNLGGAIFAASLNDNDKILTLLYAVSMFFSFQMTTTVTADPAQAQQQKLMSYMMPILWFFIGQRFASAFTLYWLGLNLFSTTLRFYVMRAPSKIPAPPQETAATLAGYPLHCPNCKALLTVGKGGKCTACGVKVKKVAPASNGKVAPGTAVTPADNK
jgi:YidC/Oxa1 family membrane protein insertase